MADQYNWVTQHRPTDYDYSDNVDEILAEQRHAADVAAAEAARVAQAYARQGSGQVINSETRAPASDAQTKFYQQMFSNGTFDERAEWGTQNKPLLGVPDSHAKPGEWFVSGDGVLVQVPPDATKDQALGFYQGVMKPFNNAAGALEDGLHAAVGAFTPDDYQNPVDVINDWWYDHGLGARGTHGPQGSKAYVQNVVDQAAREGRVPGGLGRFAGEVVGTAPLALVAPEGLAGAALVGGLSGAALSDHTDPLGIAGDVAFGATGGSLLHGLGSFVAKPGNFGAAKQVLNDMGVPITPGQIFGGIPGAAERMLAPVVPGARSAQARAFDGFEGGAVNYILDPLKQVAPKGLSGDDALGFLRPQIEEAAQVAAASGNREAMLAAQEAAERFSAFQAAQKAPGQFGPASLYAAARGTPMEPYASAGLDVLGATAPPKSGLAGRLVEGLGYGELAGLADNIGFKIPFGLGKVAGAANLAYSNPIQSMIRSSLMDSRPVWMRGLGGFSSGSRAGLAGGTLTDSLSGQPEPVAPEFQFPDDYQYPRPYGTYGY